MRLLFWAMAIGCLMSSASAMALDCNYCCRPDRQGSPACRQSLCICSRPDAHDQGPYGADYWDLNRPGGEYGHGGGGGGSIGGFWGRGGGSALGEYGYGGSSGGGFSNGRGSGDAGVGYGGGPGGEGVAGASGGNGQSPSSEFRNNSFGGGGSAAPPRLTAARAYLRASDIPPRTAAYGIVAFRSKSTSASRPKLLRVCEAYKSHLPTNSSLPAYVTDDAKMLTVWPIDNPDAPEAIADDCEFVLDHYDLYAGLSAISDASSEQGGLRGEGPYLIGWSPSNTRGAPDKLVLVVDLSDVNTQAGIDDRFKFWQKEIIEKPEQWKRGFSLEHFRVSLRDLVDRYGEDVMSAVKLVKP